MDSTSTAGNATPSLPNISLNSALKVSRATWRERSRCQTSRVCARPTAGGVGESRKKSAGNGMTTDWVEIADVGNPAHRSRRGGAAARLSGCLDHPGVARRPSLLGGCSRFGGLVGGGFFGCCFLGCCFLFRGLW